MLTPDYLADLPSPVVELYSEVETKIINAIVRRLLRGKGLTATSIWQLEKVGEMRGFGNDVSYILSKASGQSQAYINDLFIAAGESALEFDDSIYEAVGLTPSPIAKSPALNSVLEAGIRKTRGLMQNFTSTTAAEANRIFSDIMDSSYMQVICGAFSPDAVMRSAVLELAKNGLLSITYPSGDSTSIEAAVRRALITGLNQTTAELQIARADEMGCDLVEVTSHAGARLSHAVWQGRIYSRSGSHPRYADFVASTGYGTGEGLCGWNCYHSFYPFFEGLSTPSFDNNPARLLGKSNAQVYEESQKQRALERAIRNSKRECTVLDEAIKNSPTIADKSAYRAAFDKASVRLTTRREALNEFLNDTGRSADATFLSAGGFGRSVSQKAYHANKSMVEKYQKYTYYGDGTIRVTDDWSRRMHQSMPQQYKPYAVVQTVSSNGGKPQIDRTFFDENGKLSRQTHTGPHGNANAHPYGANGEHAHTFTWIDGKKHPNRDSRELTAADRKESGDVL